MSELGQGRRIERHGARSGHTPSPDVHAEVPPIGFVPATRMVHAHGRARRVGPSMERVEKIARKDYVEQVGKESSLMTNTVVEHYSGGGGLADAIAASLRKAGKDLSALRTGDLAAFDEFHIRGRKATLELAGQMNLRGDAHVLDIGSGLGGPARTLAEEYGCHVTGIDLTQSFCDAATAMSDWVGLGKRVAFQQANATHLPFADHQFDAAMTIHVAMNISAKHQMYAEARRVVRPGGIFAIYDVLQGEGGDVLFPVPWARDQSISYLVTPDEMVSLLKNASFKVLVVRDSTEESQKFFEVMMARMGGSGAPLVGWQIFLGNDFFLMARNQVRNITERRIRTVSYICEA
jgi:ubiquinone/menaquinone biosynthesis C-methylase UbiE